MMPTLTAATNVRSGLPLSTRACCMRLIAWYSAANAPVMEAVRVPPSACSTSQSSVIVRSPSIRMSTTVRRERPINRWISCVRPPIRPVLASRWPRSCVERGSIEYSAVTQPWPEPRRCAGTRSSTLAVIQTRVLPVSIRQEPSACTLTPSSTLVGRSSSGRSRPSGLGTRLVARQLEEQRGPLPEDVHRHEDEERRDRVHAWRHEIRQQAESDQPVGTVSVQPARADDPEHAQRPEDHRQLENQAEGQYEQQDEAQELVPDRQVMQVGGDESDRQYPDEERQGEHCKGHADEEEEARGPDQREDDSLLVLVQAGADEPPDLPEDDGGGGDQAHDEGDLQPQREAAGRPQEEEPGLPQARPVDQELQFPLPEDERDDRRYKPAGNGDDERPSEILQVLDDGHAGFFVPRSRAPAPMQQGHRDRLALLLGLCRR